VKKLTIASYQSLSQHDDEHVFHSNQRLSSHRAYCSIDLCIKQLPLKP